MALYNFHVDSNVTDKDLISRAKRFFSNFSASYRQQVANGNFSFGGIKLQDSDLNRLHAIVTEIDSRRVFFECGQDEIPAHAMTSLYEARSSIRDLTKGVWANPTCERIVQEISQSISDCCTKAEKLNPQQNFSYSGNEKEFMIEVTDMRLKVWALVAALKIKVGSVIQPKNLPQEIEDLVLCGEIEI
ncbi:hypothetical protein R7190_15490 [Vibrio sp. 1078-1]|uniref:hypothetical protein n=1 Tax=Vibrio sp. 1078-1 TaxID=3074544 RepID=UPI00291F80BE|nr:hypothetical protein [Vibrio sp. 1078-1]MBE3680258.1 hypothetical protein [Vibrio parahaemolyticus]MDW2370206.1 hypothetical protein [Vibrio sp. 1078-1]WMO23902.1 hypothetical protein NI374_06500 [Vibrio parahaemolyticus]